MQENSSEQKNGLSFSLLSINVIANETLTGEIIATFNTKIISRNCIDSATNSKLYTLLLEINQFAKNKITEYKEIIDPDN